LYSEAPRVRVGGGDRPPTRNPGNPWEPPSRITPQHSGPRKEHAVEFAQRGQLVLVEAAVVAAAGVWLLTRAAQGVSASH
jgi:hypothetical protein